MNNNLHGVQFTDEEKELIRSVGADNEDYAICAVFDHRNEADVHYDEDLKLITVETEGVTVEQTVEMITDVSESSDPYQRIGVGVSMLEIAVNFETQWDE